ncbi:MAG: response regulator [Campylobacterales bacterium]
MKATILIIDDMPENIKVLGETLKKHGYTIIAADSAARGLSIATTKLPDLILLDIQMPQMDGYEACQRLKANPQTASIPVIFLTAHGETEQVVKGFEVGAVDYITKPFNKAVLLARLTTHLELSRLHRQLEERVAEEIAAHKKKEELLVRQSRMAAMGEMIGAIAHQWRQPLNTLSLLVQDLKEAYKYGELDEDYLENTISRSMAAIMFMSQTIDVFRSFFTPEKVKRRFGILEALNQVLSFLESQFKSHGFTVTVLGEEIFIDGFLNEFKQVILNILSNAKDALLEHPNTNPTITITLERVKEGAQLTICDNAGGIPEEIIDQIFEPYFTTKGEDKGTGIGLYMSRMIIEEHMQGRLRAYNHNGGACFEILLLVFEDQLTSQSSE